MNSFFKYSLCSILFFSIIVQAQTTQKYSGLFSYKSSTYSGQNLKDSIKSVYFKFNEPKQSLSEAEKDNAILFNYVRKAAVIYLDKFQSITATIDNIPEYEYLPIDYKKTTEFEYNEKDWLKKSKYKTALKQYSQVCNHNLLLKLNQVVVPTENDVFQEEGKIWQNYSETIYKYIYDKQGRVIEEKEYSLFRFGKATQNKQYTEEDLFTRKLFFYNDKGQVINQKIIAGPQAKSSIEPYYTDMDTDCAYCDDLQLQYAYDSLGRITQVIMYGCGKIKDKEEYIYHPNLDYVETAKYYVSGPGSISKPTKNFVKTFNEQGDMVKIEFIPDFPEQLIKVKEYYYSYEYDSHNNWIKCNIYMEGTKEGEPTLVAERKIEYYN